MEEEQKSESKAITGMISLQGESLVETIDIVNKIKKRWSVGESLGIVAFIVEHLAQSSGTPAEYKDDLIDNIRDFQSRWIKVDGAPN